MNGNARRVVAAMLALVGVLHLALAPEYLGEEAYLGVLFIGGGIGAVALAGWLWVRDNELAWVGAALLCAGMAVGFILSRTVGLPGFHEGEWELSGILSLLLEFGVIGAAAAALRTIRSSRTLAT